MTLETPDGNVDLFGESPPLSDDLKAELLKAAGEKHARLHGEKNQHSNRHVRDAISVQMVRLEAAISWVREL